MACVPCCRPACRPIETLAEEPACRRGCLIWRRPGGCGIPRGYMAVVSHCAGRSQSPARKEGCLPHEPNPLPRHYRELDVFLAAQRRHVVRGLPDVICPGVGFDVPPIVSPRCSSRRCRTDTPRSGVRRPHAHEPWHRAHDGGTFLRGRAAGASEARRLHGRFRLTVCYRLGRSGHGLHLDRHSHIETYARSRLPQ
jgi:hypothetical protein